MTKKIALVTGGMGGIGTAICRSLWSAGYRVIAGYSRSEDRAHQWQDEQHQMGFNIDIVHADVTDYADCQRMVEYIEREIGPIDILINNAGITHDCMCGRMQKEDWDEVINTDLNSVFYVTRAVINGMRSRGFGRIVNISSINGQRGQFGQVNYSAAKAGMHGFTKALALEVAKKGITVNTVSPGYVSTDMVESLSQNIKDKILAEIPLGRFANPDEIANVVTFLVDEKNSYITGANIAINGGHYMS